VLALLLWLGLWAAQALVTWHAQKLLERTLSERLEKLVLCARLADFAASAEATPPPPT
jgi:hypothetical protein